jgi:hypothetical protein
MSSNFDLVVLITENEHPRPGWVLSLEINGVTHMFGIPGSSGKCWRTGWSAFKDSMTSHLYGRWRGDFKSSPMSDMKKVDEIPAQKILAGTVFKFPWLKIQPVSFGLSDSLSDNDILEQFESLSKQKPFSNHRDSGRWNYQVYSVREIDGRCILDRPVLSTTDETAFWNV